MAACTLYSNEGTTPGDPLVMSMYALATLPLIQKLSDPCLPNTQIWYADDATALWLHLSPENMVG